DALFISLPMSGKGYDAPAFARLVAAFSTISKWPVVVSCPLAATREEFEQHGVVTFEHDEDAMQALGHLAQHAKRQDVARRLQTPMLDDAQSERRSQPELVTSTRFLSE